MSVLALVAAVALGATASDTPRVEVTRLAPGVYAAIRREPLGLAQNGNSMFVVGTQGVLVVDAQFTREATLEHLAAIRRLTRLPVTHVVTTHWHDDHFAGNQVYADTFPNVRFLVHVNTRAELQSLGAPNRRGTAQGAPPMVERYSRFLAQGLGPDSTPLSPLGREAMTHSLRIMRQYLAELPTFRETMAGPPLQDSETVDLGGGQVVEVRWPGRATTRGNVVVRVPRHNVVAVGDLVVAPVPFGFGTYPREWVAALDALAAWAPAAIVPGHGPVMTDVAFLRNIRMILAAAADGAERFAAQGAPARVAVDSVTLPGHRLAVTRGDAWLEYMWRNHFLPPVVASAHAQARGRRGPTTSGVQAFTNVNVVTMGRDSVIRGATVLVRDGRIAAVGRGVQVPAGARRVDVGGRWMIPGLADMHTHLYSDDRLPDSLAPAELGVMLANGLTTARLMIGTPEQLALRRQASAGTVAGPQLWVASPQLAGRQYDNGIAVTTPEAARAAVRAVADSGYDFVKLTLFITPPVYDAIVDEARLRGIRVVGHVTPEVGVERALAARQQIEHLDSYFEAALRDSAPMRTSVTQQLVFNPANWASLDHIDDVKLARIAGRTARAGVWSVPTLHVFNVAFAAQESDSLIRARADWQFLPDTVRTMYLRARERYWAPATVAAGRTPERRARYVQVRNALVKAIADSGGRLMAGSDTPEWFNAYGFGLHRELAAFVQAGLTPYRALTTATTEPARFLGQQDEWGSIEPGKRADLVLLDANPLDDIRNTERIHAVVVGGRVYSRAELDAMLAAGRAAMREFR